MGRIRTGTVGFSYRDWSGVFYPQGAPPRRQLNIYCEQFDVCELMQFTHHMPDRDRVEHFTSQIKSDVKMFVRIHNAFTHCADAGLALTLAKHFRKAMEPMFQAGKLGGLVASFPYAFKNTDDRCEYLIQLSSLLSFEGVPLQVDFRHPGWCASEAQEWLMENNLALVCVDEPALPGLVPPIAVATSDVVMVRLHGRNADGWWSGNSTTRYDYCYTPEELRELADRYAPLISSGSSVHFLFQNHWQAQSAHNALQLKAIFEERAARMAPVALPDAAVSAELAPSVLTPLPADDDATRPPTTLPLSEIKSRVTREFSSIQGAFELPLRTTDDSSYDEPMDY